MRPDETGRFSEIKHGSVRYTGGSDQDMSDQEEDALALEDDERLMVEISHLDLSSCCSQ